MRITTKEIDVFKRSVPAKDNEAKIYLFGSKIDDEKRGVILIY